MNPLSTKRIPPSWDRRTVTSFTLDTQVDRIVSSREGGFRFTERGIYPRIPGFNRGFEPGFEQI